MFLFCCCDVYLFIFPSVVSVLFCPRKESRGIENVTFLFWFCDVYLFIFLSLVSVVFCPRKESPSRGPPLGSHAVPYSFRHFLQKFEYSDFCGSDTSELFTCVFLFWQSLKQNSLVCHRTHIGFSFRNGRSVRFFPANTSL